MARILHIIPTLDHGGAEKQLTLLACELKRRGWDVHVACLTRGGPWERRLAAAQVPVTVIGKRFKVDPRAYIQLQRYIQSLQPDLVQTWLFAANSYGRKAASASGVKHIVASERCVDPWKSWWQFAIDRWLLRHTSRIVTNSAGVVDFYQQHGIPAEIFTVIPNGISLPEPESFPMERAALLQELQLPPQARLIGAIGRLWPQKRLKDLIWAFDLLQNVVDDVHLLIIGDGPQRWRLERYARQVTPPSRVHFLGTRDDVPNVLPHLECVLLGSEYEGQSNAIMEAMAVGLPVISTDIPGNRDLVVPGVTGYLLPIGDRAGFATAMRELLEDRSLANRLGRAGQERMRTKFSLQQMVQRYEALYAELLGP